MNAKVNYVLDVSRARGVGLKRNVPPSFSHYSNASLRTCSNEKGANLYPSPR